MRHLPPSPTGGKVSPAASPSPPGNHQTLSHPPPEVYLDNNATTPPLPEVRSAVLNALAAFGNPSSSHTAGERARGQLREARSSLASLLGCDPASVVFTSGATEANNTVLRSFLRSRPEENRLHPRSSTPPSSPPSTGAAAKGRRWCCCPSGVAA